MPCRTAPVPTPPSKCQKLSSDAQKYRFSEMSNFLETGLGGTRYTSEGRATLRVGVPWASTTSMKSPAGMIRPV